MKRRRERRSSVLYVRLTATELRQLRARADRSGMQLSEFVRDELLRDDQKRQVKSRIV